MKYSNKKSIKSVGVFARLFGLFSNLFPVDKFEKSIKSVVMSFHGKSKKQIDEHFKMQEYLKEMQMKEEAKKQLNL